MVCGTIECVVRGSTGSNSSGDQDLLRFWTRMFSFVNE